MLVMVFCLQAPGHSAFVEEVTGIVRTWAEHGYAPGGHPVIGTLGRDGWEYHFRVKRTGSILRFFVSTAFIATVMADGIPPLALERLQTRVGFDQGLPLGEVYSLAQDTRGFIWIGTSGGLYRYDGVELRPWPRTPFRHSIVRLVAGPTGEIVGRDREGRIFAVAGDEFVPLPGQPVNLENTEGDPVWDARGDLWIASPRRLVRYTRSGEWLDYPLERFGGETPYRLTRTPAGEVMIVTSGGVWRLDESGRARRLVAQGRLHHALVKQDGRLVLLDRAGSVEEIVSGKTRAIFASVDRPIDMLITGDTLWVTHGASLTALREGFPPETLDGDDGIPSGGPLLLDREGGLWMATFRGLLHFPVPETVAWGLNSGLPNTVPLALAASDEGIWVNTWTGLGLLRPSGPGWAAGTIPGSLSSAVCAATDAAVWTGYRGRIIERRAGRIVEHEVEQLDVIHACADGAAGRVWLNSNLGLFVARPGGRAAVLGSVSTLPPSIIGRGGISTLLETADGSLVISAGEEICETSANQAAAPGSAHWRCDTIDGVRTIVALVESSRDSVWAATLQSGVYRKRAGGGWEIIPGSKNLPSRQISALRRSPRGGAWLLGFQTFLRLEDHPGSPDGWEVVERLSPWHGLMVGEAQDILEEDTGDLWLATLAGVVRIPVAVRDAAPVEPPPVELVDVLADGHAVAWQDGMDLPFSRNRIELRFAGLSFRDPSLLRYQVRLDPDSPWRDASGQPLFRFVDLPPGDYHAEVRASLDGKRWSPDTAGISFTVLPPFWRTWWFMTLCAVLAAGMVYAVHKYRLAHALRLERVRTRIAADLHDDIGASLSRIALQSEVARRSGSSTGMSDRLLEEIGDSARSVVDNMSDIVWSVDPRRDDLTSLVTRLRQFALGLLEPRGIALEFPTPPTAGLVRLDPEQRRHLYLILKESVNNIAKHAEPTKAWIRIDLEGTRLRVEIGDNGRGINESGPDGEAPASRDGHGLLSMKARASQMGGDLVVVSSPDRGTLLTLVVTLEARGA